MKRPLVRHTTSPDSESGPADRVKRDALDRAFDETPQECGRVAIAASAGIVGVIGDDERLVAGLALPRARHRLGDRQQLDRREIARLPRVVHEFLGDCLRLRAIAVDGDRH